MVMTRPPAYHPGNFLMKNMNPTNSGLMLSKWRKANGSKRIYYGHKITDRHIIWAYSTL